MPPEGDPNQPDGQGTDPIDDAIDGAGAGPATAVALAPEAVRALPEFKALERENRKLRRDAGSANAAAAAAREAAEAIRQAAEAQQQAALEADVAAALGDDGVAFWQEFAELSTTDPRAAARRLAEVLAQARVQSPAGDAGAAGDPDATAAGGTGVPAQTPPPPSRGVDGGAPLQGSPAADDPLRVAEALESDYNELVGRVQDPITRNRVTQRDRNRGFISFLGAAYVKAGAIARSPRG